MVHQREAVFYLFLCSPLRSLSPLPCAWECLRGRLSRQGRIWLLAPAPLPIPVQVKEIDVSVRQLYDGDGQRKKHRQTTVHSVTPL